MAGLVNSMLLRSFRAFGAVLADENDGKISRIETSNNQETVSFRWLTPNVKENLYLFQLMDDFRSWRHQPPLARVLDHPLPFSRCFELVCPSDASPSAVWKPLECLEILCCFAFSVVSPTMPGIASKARWGCPASESALKSPQL